MSETRNVLLREAAARGKYSPLYVHLGVRVGREWHTTFRELESILGFELPPSARIHRPWWANPGRSGGHSHALAWIAAGWRTENVDMEGETLTFARNPEAADREGTGIETDIESRRPVSIDDIFTPHDFGPWPAGFLCSREELYGDDGRQESALFIDTNVLVAARVPGAPQFDVARGTLSKAFAGTEPLRISRQILREYLAAVTRPQSWSLPLGMAEALRDVERMSALFEILEDGPRVTGLLEELCREVSVAGKQIHDANIVATMLAHGERRLVTLNGRDFRRFGDRLELVPVVE